jgi:hypothetical protein
VKYAVSFETFLYVESLLWLFNTPPSEVVDKLEVCTGQMARIMPGF